jgi:hypothetical protein
MVSVINLQIILSEITINSPACLSLSAVAAVLWMIALSANAIKLSNNKVSSFNAAGMLMV